jgi:hypothetical protein
MAKIVDTVFGVFGRKVVRQSVFLLVALGGLAAYAIRRPQRLPRYVSEFDSQLAFRRVAEPGFDVDGRARLADSAWSMRYFRAEGAMNGYLYVGTDNNIVGLSLAAFRKRAPQDPVRPPQIRRYRPDIGAGVWEIVLDYDDYEDPPYNNQGFRSMGVYTTRADGKTYLYAGTMATRSPTVWRSASGDPGTWELVYNFPYDPDSPIGSVRGMIAHDDGLLYVSTTRAGDILPGGKGQIWATDGETFFPVVTDGFGDPGNTGITTLDSFNGCLYAGTYNPQSGFELWKLRCLSDPDGEPQQIIHGGGVRQYNEAALSLHAFDGALYLGTGIPLGFNPKTRHGPRGCHVFRIYPDDDWEVVVGPRRSKPESQYKGGFGWYMNSYCWYMEDHGEYLYLGTWDLSRTIAYLGENAERVAPPFKPLLNYLDPSKKWGAPVGGDLYRTTDGVHWEPVFLDGLGNPDNHGVRTLASTPDGFFVGTENPFTRLEVWQLVEP